jgi:hypothetical protein
MDLSPENFDRLMNWLHPNREEAGREYQRIRTLLIKNFQRQGCSSPESLADVTMDRVAQTLTEQMIENWVGEKERYCYRVGFYIVREDRARSHRELQLPEELDVPNPDAEEDIELNLQCLKKCLQKQSAANGELIVNYYRGKPAVKIKKRVELARDMNFNLPRLRVHAHRIRKELRKCIEGCLENAERSYKG